jgi:uncharacterized DUF497 family protein
MIEFDPEKDRQNIAKHGISLARASELEVMGYARQKRGTEPRYRIYGLIDGRWFCLIYTMRKNAIRAISLRRAHEDEVSRYAKKAD